MTYRYFANDILETLKKNFDDADITMSHVIYWTLVGANRLNKLHAEKRDTGKFTTIFSSVSVKLDTALKDRKFIDLPAKMLDINNDKGIEYITFNFESCSCCEGPNFAQVLMQPTTPAKSHRLYMSLYEKPDPSNTYFYRIGERVYFLGVECINLKDVEIGIKTALDPEKVCDLDTELEVPEHLIQTLRAEVLNMGRMVLLVPADRVNEGSDETEEAVKKRGGVPSARVPAQETEQRQ